MRAGAAEQEVRKSRRAKIIVIDDDPDIGELLELLLSEQGHIVKTSLDGAAALDLVAAGAIRPDIILADYNLPNGMNGLAALAALRRQLHHDVPGVILTGDISSAALAEIALHDCVQLSKPVNAAELAKVVDRLLPVQVTAAPRAEGNPMIYVVDDDPGILETVREVLEGDGRTVSVFGNAESFLAGYSADGGSCLLIDAYLPGMSGIDLLRSLRTAGDQLPTILFTGQSDVATAVAAMRAGASDFIAKPVAREALLKSIDRALLQAHDLELAQHDHDAAGKLIASLTSRQLQVMELVLAGHPSKNIAADLGISQRTVENHRAAMMHKTGTKSLPELARLAITAEVAGHAVDQI